jgi:hypothetical protein
VLKVAVFFAVTGGGCDFSGTIRRVGTRDFESEPTEWRRNAKGVKRKHGRRMMISRAAIVIGAGATVGAGLGLAPEALTALGDVGGGVSLTGSLVNCSADGWGSFSCGRSLAVTAGSYATGEFVAAASKPAVRARIEAASLAWNALG